ncbi:pseudouridine synthase [Parasphaerochaeta coccoides]|uniref:Pseudouridine synthase n=1 Tax=Parasphaerochaeta coccoides (strain ATCC BAA-1237 / DSM 17374 / SPN1) TaxID=760011 RepID=F4GK67_PARC1|nr:pseudouridine synthase [Parasphaerochaeta coccoides]AEC01839.1 pseudouridine synthase Rsu [Parasphaerochaeta coccoides DSM 17374]
MKTEYPIRLQSFLAKSGWGSRRSCEQLIIDGRVKVNSQVVRELGTKVDKDDAVYVDGVLAEPNERTYYYALHKPAGYVCSNADPNESYFARDLIDVPERNLLFNIGRLDKESTGLVLFTNDGEISQLITHPSYEIEKEYLVNTDRTIMIEDLQEARHGIRIDDGRPYRISRYKLETKRWVRIILTEGRNREIRKIFTYLGYDVKKLIRIRIGTLELGDLAPAQFRRVTKDEIMSIVSNARNKGQGGAR